MDEIVNHQHGLAAADNNRFLRFWKEVDVDHIKLDATSNSVSVVSGKKWIP